MSAPLTPGRLYDVTVDRSGETEDLFRDLVFDAVLEPFYVFFQRDDDPSRVALSPDGVSEDEGRRIFINRAWIRVIREQPEERARIHQIPRAGEDLRTGDAA